MPQYQQPTDLPSWTTGGPTQVTAPTAAQRASGFTTNQRPTSVLLNYLFFHISNWIKFLSQGINAVLVGSQQEFDFRLIAGGQFSWSATSGTLSWSESAFISMPGLLDTANTIAAGSVSLTAGQVAYVLGNVPFSTTGTTTSASAQVTNLAFESGITPGISVTGPGIPSNTTVVSVSASDNSITLSSPATASASGITLVFASSGPLTVQAVDVASFAPSANTIVIARCIAGTPNIVHVGVNSGQMRLVDRESKSLLSDGYVATTRVTAGADIAAGQAVYLGQGATDSVNTFRDAGAGTAIALYGDGQAQTPTQAKPLVGDTVAGDGVSSGTTITAVSGSNITVSKALSVANVGLAAAALLTITRQTGLCYATDASGKGPLQRAQPLGFATTATAKGGSVHIVASGKLAAFSALAAGFPYFLSATTDGAVQQTAPTTPGQYLTPVGVAINATTLLLSGAAASQGTLLRNPAYKSTLGAGFFWSNATTSAPTTALTETISIGANGTSVATITKRNPMTHAGSVVGISAHYNNTVNQPSTLSVFTQNGQLCALQIPAAQTDTTTAFAKGLYPFNVGDVLTAMAGFGGTTGLSPSLTANITVEYTP